MGELLNRVRMLRKYSDAWVAIGVLGLFILLIVPLPPLFLDVLICLSLVMSVMTLLLALYVEDALDFSAFPSLLLFLTLYRLGLNIASTRMILTRAEGGDIIHTFGEIVTGGNWLVGVILFGLLTLINFIVVTKGAGRIAEVAARFMLEALPGKQLAIDSELASGALSSDQARLARQQVSEEANFYGAMDGSSKFVRGDAIAGIIITLVNIVGGILVGIAVKQLSWSECLGTMTRLTVGDGLVSQVPALFISVAAGIMVTRAAKGSVGKALTEQVFHHPRVLLMAGGVVGGLGLVPGMPLLVMLPIAAAFFVCGLLQNKEQKEKTKDLLQGQTRSFLTPPLELRLGFQLAVQGPALYARLGEVRSDIAKQLGIRMPQVEISDDSELSSRGWEIYLKGNPVATGREGDMGSIVNALKSVMRGHAHELLTRAEVQWMIQETQKNDSAIVEEFKQKQLSFGDLLKVLKGLLKEGVPVRDFISILEVLVDAGEEKDLDLLIERVRAELSRGITDSFFGKSRVAHVITLDPKVEQVIDASKGKLRPSMVDNLARSLISLTKEASLRGLKPVVVTESNSRASLRQLIEKKLPELHVLSYREVSAEVEMETVGMVPNDVLLWKEKEI